VARLAFLDSNVLTNDTSLSFTDIDKNEPSDWGNLSMSEKAANRLSTIRRSSRALLIFFIFMSVISLWATANNIVHPFPPGTRTLAGIVFQGSAITTKIQNLWLMQMLLGAAISLKVLYHLIRLMMMYTKGRLFTAHSVGHLRHAGLTYACGLLIWLVVLIGIAPEIAAAQDQWLKIMPSFPAWAVMGAGLFLYASRIMDEGRELRDEQDLVV
jgi:hypothetical protein